MVVGHLDFILLTLVNKNTWQLIYENVEQDIYRNGVIFLIINWLLKYKMNTSENSSYPISNFKSVNERNRDNKESKVKWIYLKFTSYKS